MVTTATTTWSTYPVEVEAGQTTTFLPLTTAYPSIAGCQSQFWKFEPTVLAGWDPGYGLFGIQTDFRCHPAEVTSWWDEEHFPNVVDTSKTVWSIGPIVCPQAYTTASTSVNAAQRTFVGCCPNEYTFVNFFAVGDTGECVSNITPGQVFTYVTSTTTDTSWVKVTSTVSTESQAYAIPVNGWLFPNSDTTTTAPTGSITSNQASATNTNPSSTSGLSTGAKIGIGVGIPLAVLALAAIGLAIFFIRRGKRRVQNAAWITTHEPKPADYTHLQPGTTYYSPMSTTEHGSTYHNQYSGPSELGDSATPLSELHGNASVESRVELPAQYHYGEFVEPKSLHPQ